MLIKALDVVRPMLKIGLNMAGQFLHGQLTLRTLFKKLKEIVS